MLGLTQRLVAHRQLRPVFRRPAFEEPHSCDGCFVFFFPPLSFCTLSQGFTYVAPSVLENVKEKFSFEPKVRSPRKFPGSPRTPVRYQFNVTGFPCGQMDPVLDLDSVNPFFLSIAPIGWD